jgi:hypothetical protein
VETDEWKVRFTDGEGFEAIVSYGVMERLAFADHFLWA